MAQCDVSADASFGAPSLNANLCKFQLKLPSFKVGFRLPGIFPIPIPIPKFGFALSCDPSKPIDVTAGVSFGGGRLPCFVQSPDDADDF